MQLPSLFAAEVGPDAFLDIAEQVAADAAARMASTSNPVYGQEAATMAKEIEDACDVAERLAPDTKDTAKPRQVASRLRMFAIFCVLAEGE